jgi:uncharacterized membrane-anchored protein
MKYFIIIGKVVFAILLVANAFIGLVAQASSHNIPFSTNLIFGIRVLVSFALLLLFIFLGRRLARRISNSSM